MAVYEDREHFIPFRKSEIVDLCCEDAKDKLSEEEIGQFKDFCNLLQSLYHFQFHGKLETLKDSFAPFNPDADTKTTKELSKEELAKLEDALEENLRDVLVSANYNELTDEDWQYALEQESLITLNLDVDEDDYERKVIFHRGEKKTTAEIKKFLSKKELEMEIYERVVMLLKFKDAEHFKKKGMKPDKLPFTPGKTYVYLYKNIPKADLEILFPNVRISMNSKDKLMLGVPASLAAIPMLLKLLPNILLLIGAILVLTGIKGGEQHLFDLDKKFQENIKKTEVTKDLQKAFKDKKILLAKDAIINEKKKDEKWEIVNGDETYFVNKRKDNLVITKIPEIVTKIAELDLKFEKDLEKGEIGNEFKVALGKKSIKFKDPEILTKEEGKKWKIKDKNKIFYFEKDDDKIIVNRITKADKGAQMQVLVGSLTLLIALGGFAFKQFVKYKNKRIQFMKQVTDTLFFRNLDSNQGVFHFIIDAAEEEECKEAMLAYYHLLTQKQDLTEEALDDFIEEWFEKKYEALIDFEVDDALRKLIELELMTRDDKGICKVVSLDKALERVDYIWDNIFQYNTELDNA